MSHAAATGTIPTPLPRIRAFERLGFGMFVHWGLYSQLGQGEWVWTYHESVRRDYGRLQQTFTAADFDARALVHAAKAAGMRYVCHTTRHHEGFSLFDTRGLNTYDSMHSPAGRDLVAEFCAACEAEGMGKYLYHTTLDWWHPDFDGPGRWDAYLDYLNRSVEILCTRYGRIDGLWFDGNWSRRDRDWKEDALYALIRRHQPDAIIVNNSSTGALGADGHPEVDVRTFEQGRPKPYDHRGKAKYKAAEMCDTVNSHWGIGANDLSHKSPAQIIDRLVASRRVGANYLLNVGPTATGALPGYERELLALVGRWAALCPAALYDAVPSELICRGQDFALRDGSTWYYFCHNLPIHGNSHLLEGDSGAGLKAVSGALPAVRRIAWVDRPDEVLEFSQDQTKGWLTFQATPYPYGTHLAGWRIARIDCA
ncbi:MAG TPA: alpha-L-fucosidase [Planctomycetes bacterium]|nr:alpha-L-fucosidase [Planctomycetota bacterium]